MEATTADYIVLCDQDDIWPNERLEVMLEEIRIKDKDKDKDKGIMLFTDLELIDDQGHRIASSFYNLNKINPLKILNLINCYGIVLFMGARLYLIELY